MAIAGVSEPTPAHDEALAGTAAGSRRPRALGLAVATVLLAAVLGLLLVWQRGMYSDDYTLRSFNIDLATGAWRPTLRPMFPRVRVLGQIVGQNVATMLPDHELLGRTMWLGVHLLNVALVALLTHRLTASALAATLAAFLFAMPIWSSEIVVWFVQGCQHLPATTLFLVGLLCALGAMSAPTGGWRIGACSLAAFAVGLHFSELPVPSIGLLPVLGLLGLLVPSERTRWRARLGVAFTLAAFGMGIAFLHYALFTGRYVGTQDTMRGALAIATVVDRYREYLTAVYSLTLRPDWGWRLTREAFALGGEKIAGNPAGVALLLALVAGAGGWIWWVRLPAGEERERVTLGVAVFALGVLWFLVSLLPGTLLARQILEPRMLYFGFAGVTVGLGALLWTGLVLLQDRAGLLRRALVALPVCGLVLSTIVMVGYCETYRLRGREDARQIRAVRAVVGPLEPDTTFIIVRPDFRFLPRRGKERVHALERLLTGVFERSWSAEGALYMAYRRTDLRVATTHHWAPKMQFRLRPGVDERFAMEVESVPAPIERSLALTYRDGRVVLLSPLVFPPADGRAGQVIPLPRVERYRPRGVAIEPLAVAEVADIVASPSGGAR